MLELDNLHFGAWQIFIHWSIAAYMSSPCHIELILSEKEEPVKKEVIFNIVVNLYSLIMLFLKHVNAGEYV